MYIVSLIPARGGSKGIPDKNIKLLNNKPLIAYSIETSLNSAFINETIVTTDSKQIAEVAIRYGANVPFIRPSNISQDKSLDIEFVKHYLEWVRINKQRVPDIIVQLRPTYPIRNCEFLDEAIHTFVNRYEKYDSLRSVIEFEKSAFKMYHIDEHYDDSTSDQKLIPVIPSSEYMSLRDPHNMCRQDLPKTYLHNGCIDIFKTSIVIGKNTISGNNIYPLLMNKGECYDIDSMEDWNKTEEILKSNISHDV
jgi:CMP-N,N'-diacetyllegionaminic acid synthase